MATANVTEALDRPERSTLGLVVFFGGAAFLAPWIVVLFRTQKLTGRGYHLHVVSVGISLCLLVGLLVTARLARRRSKMVLLSAAFCGTLAFITAWFGSVTLTGRAGWILLGYALVVLAPVTVLSFWVVRATYVRRAGRVSLPAWVPPVFVVAAISVLLPIGVGLTAVPSAHAAVHLRAVWTGLDCLELSFLIASGVCVWRRSSALAVTAMCLGTLMFADAWYNIVATRGAAELAALVMALGELPLSGYSVYASHHEVRRWPEPEQEPEPAP